MAFGRLGIGAERRRCVANHFQDFLRLRKIGKSFADMPPALVSVHIHQQSGIQRDIAPIDAAVRVHQAVAPDNLSPRVAQNGELAVRHGFPHVE